MKPLAAKKAVTILLLTAGALAAVLLFRRVSNASSVPASSVSEALRLAVPHALAVQLTEPDRRSMLEDRLGRPVEIYSYRSENEDSELSSLCNDPNFDGILFFRDPLSIIPLSQQGLLSDLTDLLESGFLPNDREQFAARYQGIQYGIVLPQDTERYFAPLLALRTDILQQYGYSGFPETAEGCRHLFGQLYANGLVPFAAYGMPTSVSFAPLLSLFSLNSEGNGEFRWEDSQIVYDKVSPSAADYLAFVHDLYAQGCLPSNFLSTDFLSVAELFIRGKTPFLVVSSPKEASVLHTLCEKHEISLGFEALSPRSGYPHIAAVRDYDIIAVSHFAKDLPEMERFCGLLLSDPAVQELFRLPLTPWEQELASRYEISCTQTMLDPVSARPPHLRLMKIFDQLNTEIVRPYYAKITTGDLPPDAFWEMCGKWSRNGGSNLLEMLTRYCSASGTSKTR